MGQILVIVEEFGNGEVAEGRGGAVRLLIFWLGSDFLKFGVKKITQFFIADSFNTRKMRMFAKSYNSKC